jgi:hypothetical protein
MKPPHIILSIWVTLILSSILSVSAAVPSSPPAGMENYPGGKFSTYFSNMVQTGPCATGYVLTGFAASNNADYGKRSCTSLKAIMWSIYGSTAPANTVFNGFKSNGDIDWSPSTWLKSWTNLYYNTVWGNVGIGTSTPTAKLEVNGKILSANTQWVGNVHIGWLWDGFTYSSLVLDGDNDKNWTTNAWLFAHKQSPYAGALLIGKQKTSVQYQTSMSLLDNGNVWIGTNTPTAKLEVNGKIKMTSQTISSDTSDTVATKGYVDANGWWAWITTIVTWSNSACRDYSFATCPSGYTLISGWHEFTGSCWCDEKHRFPVVSKPFSAVTWWVWIECATVRAYAICMRN